MKSQRLVDWNRTRFLCKDDNSRILLDGREILQGVDWKLRKLEAYERAKGMCEQLLASPDGFIRCQRIAEDIHHIRPRGSNGIDRDDRLENLQCLCRRHHRLIDRREIKWKT